MHILRKTAISAAVIAATVTGGALGATMIGTANAQTATTAATAAASTATTAAPSTAAPATAKTPSGPHQANGKTETLLTGDDLAKATAAVEAKEPGATIDRAETDADGAVYEAHITRADGTKATVKLDASFTVTADAEGMN